MKRAERKVIAAIMAAVLLVCIFPTAAYADNDKISALEEQIRKNKEEQEQTEGKIGESKEELENLQQTTEGLKGQLNSLNSNLTEVSNNLADLEEQIKAKNEEIEQTNVELAEAKEVEEAQYAAMKKRIQFMYEKQDYVLLEMLFGAASFSDLLNRNDYIEQLSKYDREQLEEYKATRTGIEEKETKLEQEKKELRQLRKEKARQTLKKSAKR
ncbi:MAG: cell wall hydrolase, partial [Lachnospiraceae bacterium]|nr:cell wall hydrolase [Lachnospiraceae bacterium]